MRVSGWLMLALGALYAALPGSAQEVTDADALPDGLFEFLGMMVEHNGELIDPLSLIGPESKAEDRRSDSQLPAHRSSRTENDDAAVAEEHPDER